MIPEAKRRIMLGALFFATLLVSYYGLFQYIFSFLINLQATYAPSLLLVWVLIVLCGFILLMIPSLITSLLDEITTKSKVQTKDQELKKISKLRLELLDKVDERKLSSLDEYWEIVIVVITLSVLVLSMVETSIAPLADWTQVSITLIFWGSYKFGKAKHSVDLRLLSIAAMTQFLLLIISLYLMAGFVDFLVFQWMQAGSPIQHLFLLGQSASIGWILILYSIIAVFCLVIYFSRNIAEFASRRCWNYLLKSEKSDNVIDTEALYLSKNALPPYLFYGCVWFLALIVPLPVQRSEYYFALLITAIIVLFLITFGWISNILRVQYQILDYSPGLLLRNIIKAVGFSKGLFAYVASGIVIGLMLYMAPFFSFGTTIESIGIANAINGALILFIVQAVSVRKNENTQ